MLRKANLPLFLALVATAVLLLGWHHRTLGLSGSHYLTQDGDALKNYFTPLYHVLHDSSYTHFEGMNYPYGEHVVYTDCQPAIANTLKAIHSVIPLSFSTILAILNLLMFLQVFISVWLIYRICRHFSLPEWLSALGAVGIALLSPQWLRTSGHFALTYTFVLPVAWWLLLKNLEHPRLLRSFATAVLLFIFGWIHPYLLMISGIFLFLAWMSDAAIRKRWISVLHGLIAGALPLIAFKLSVSLTDHVTDRPDQIYGHEAFSATWEGIFAPWSLFPGAKWLPGETPPFEGQSYIGIAGVFFILLLFLMGLMGFLRVFQSSGKGKFRRLGQISGNQLSKLPSGMLPSLIAAGLLLALATGFPFLKNPDRWVDIFPPLEQFRAPGRFAWVFFWVWNVFALYGFWRLGNRYMIGALPLVMAGILIVEGNFMQKTVDRRLAPVAVSDIHQTVQKWTANMAEKPDAHLVLPFFHIGSENLYANHPASVEFAFPLALETGIPLMNSMMSRTSFEQTWKQFQWLWPYRFEAPEIFRDIPQNTQIQIWKMPVEGGLTGPATLFPDASPEVQTHTFNSSAVNKIAAISHSQNQSNPSRNLITQLGFEQESTPGKTGIGLSLPTDKNNWMELIESAKPGKYLVEFWIKARESGRPNVYLILDQRNVLAQTTVWDFQNLNDFIVGTEGEWALVTREFEVAEEGNRVRLNVTGLRDEPAEIWLDELVVWELGEKK